MTRKPKFKSGDIVYWGNGVYKLFWVLDVNTLHCPDGCFSYRLSSVDPKMREFNSDWTADEADCVSEEVLKLIKD